MTAIDWPARFDRTDPARRSKNRNFEATLAKTTKDLATEMDRLDPEEWRASIGNSHTKTNTLPRSNANPDDPGFVLRWTKDGQQFAVACDAYSRLRDNVREVYLWVHETRMRGNRAVVTGESEFTAARLPNGDGEAVVASPPPHDVLDVAPDAPDGVVEAAYREKTKEMHPDHGGSTEAFQRLKRAKEAMLDA
ncbi:J domain-containing protein [Haloarcula sp. JP-L23]|uniref:J domain-containing protein n=1 Tax=Haloarcula sp. JP-L23 TaxID=2716717 RepID=UPI00140F29DF|nr:J domain-containing protein [Haloarcula sp. JP-L23]